MIQILQVLPFPVSITIFLIFLLRRRSMNRMERASTDEKYGSYEASQILGMFGIILFLVPIFLIIIMHLFDPLMWLIAWVLGKLSLPEIVVTLISVTVAIAVLTSAFVGTYLLSEYIWPKRPVVNQGEQIKPL